MRRIVLFITTFCFIQVSFAEIYLPSSYLSKNKTVSQIIQSQKTNTPSTILRKKSLKEKLLLKWLKRNIDEESKKKEVNALGWISFICSLLGLIVFPIGWAAFGFAIVGLALSFLSIVFGIFSLTKRSKLKDKSGTKRWPGLLGILLGSGFLVAIGIWLLIELS